MSEHPITRYRKAHGLTLQAIADIVKVSRVTIWNIEHGVHAPSLALAQRFIDRTGLTPEDFLRRQAEAAE